MINQMNRDLTYILNGKIPRQYGSLPLNMGNYEMIAPSPIYEKIFGVLNRKEGIVK